MSLLDTWKIIECQTRQLFPRGVDGNEFFSKKTKVATNWGQMARFVVIINLRQYAHDNKIGNAY